jgi:hypothetical protein
VEVGVEVRVTVGVLVNVFVGTGVTLQAGNWPLVVPPTAPGLVTEIGPTVTDPPWASVNTK